MGRIADQIGEIVEGAMIEELPSILAVVVEQMTHGDMMKAMKLIKENSQSDFDSLYVAVVESHINEVKKDIETE